jgi:hypothetical protein
VYNPFHESIRYIVYPFKISFGHITDCIAEIIEEQLKDIKNFHIEFLFEDYINLFQPKSDIIDILSTEEMTRLMSILMNKSNNIPTQICEKKKNISECLELYTKSYKNKFKYLIWKNLKN